MARPALAEPTLHAGDPASKNLRVKVYGSGSNGCVLYEDDGKTLKFRAGEFNRVQLSWDAGSRKGSTVRSGSAKVPQYTVKEWIEV